MLPSLHVSRLENYKLFCCFSLFHLSHTCKSSKKCIPTRPHIARVPDRSVGSPSSQRCKGKWGSSLHPMYKLAHERSRKQTPHVSGKWFTASGDSWHSLLRKSKIPSHHLTVSAVFPDSNCSSSKAVWLPAKGSSAPHGSPSSDTENPHVHSWGHWLTNLLWQFEEPLPQTVLPVPLPKVSVSTEGDDWKTGHQKDLLWISQ